jgi:hypothetical protein
MQDRLVVGRESGSNVATLAIVAIAVSSPSSRSFISSRGIRPRTRRRLSTRRPRAVARVAPPGATAPAGRSGGSAGTSGSSSSGGSGH